MQIEDCNCLCLRPMTSTTRIPSIFSSYLSAPPPTSLLLLTSVLGASTNWLLLHFLLAIFSPGLVSGIEGNEEPGTNKSEAKVVFVSFLRDWDFWREGSKRVVGRLILRSPQCDEAKGVTETGA